MTVSLSSFFFKNTATTEIYTLSLHDALPIWRHVRHALGRARAGAARERARRGPACARLRVLPQPRPRLAPRLLPDRKSTRLNSSHTVISYAVFCLKKKKKKSKTIVYKTLHHS